jgi:16S rRNA (uracil1498-N3)-methyltransferase
VSSLWLHVSEIPEPGGSVAIPRDEARHAFDVRRLGADDTITLFDGNGVLATARMPGERVQGERVQGARTRHGDRLVEVVTREVAPPLAPEVGVAFAVAPEVGVAFAVPKGDRLSLLLDGTTQAGVSRLVPIECARSVVDADKLDRGERWQRILAEATKVAKRAWMPELVPGGALAAVARAERARGAAIAVAHTSGAEPISAWIGGLSPAVPRTVFIGPEGGVEDGEIAELRAHGAATVSLGPCVMRVELAAIAATVLLRA